MSTRRRLRAARLVPAAAAAWGAAALVVCLPEVSAATAAGLWLAAALCAAVSRRARSTAATVLAVAALAGAVTASHGALAAPSRADLVHAVPGVGRAVVVEAVISGKLERSGSGDVWFDVLSQRVTVGQREIAAPHPLRIGVPASDLAALDGADVGSALTVRGGTIPPDPGDRAVLIVRAAEVNVRGGDVPAPLRWASVLRDRLVASAASLPGAGAALVPGLAVGDTSAVDEALDADMKASSLSHLTAVSGANCALVVGLAYGLAALCRARRAWRIGAGLTALALFVLLVTPEPSVVRAGAMATIAMLALALGRANAGLSILSLAVVALLAVDPWLALSLGFALSTVATASLLILARPLAEGLSRWMPRPLGLALAVPLAAQLACGPLLVLVDPQVPLLGVAANLLAAPAAPLATLAGLAGCLAAPVPVLQDGLVALAWIPATWVAGIARAVASLPGQQLPWAGELGGLLLLAGCSAGIAAVIALPVRGRTTAAVRALAWTVVVLVGGVGGGQVVLRTVGGTWTVPAGWSIAACEIGQGDAVLLRSDDRIALVDTGPDPAPMSACLDRLGVARVDLLVLTHFDLDHVGGLDALVGRADLVVHGPTDGAEDERRLAELAAAGAALRRASPGMQGLLGEARWRVLWPTDRVAPGNDASVVLDVRGGGLPDTLLLGDLSAEAQRAMRRSSPLGEYAVVKVAHHGSADQDPGLYAAARPDVGLITVGPDNDYGHPRDSILSTLRSLGTVVARTDTEGVLAVWQDADGRLHLWRERGVGGSG